MAVDEGATVDEGAKGAGLTLAEADVRAMVRLMADVAATPGGLLPQKRRLVEGLAALVDADRYMWNVTRFTAEGPPVALSLLHNWSEPHFAAISEWNYTRPDARSNLAFAELTRASAGRPWSRSLEQLAGPGWWAAEQASCDAARRTEMGSAVFCCHPVAARTDTVSMLGLHRAHGRAPWTEREIRVAHVVFTEVSWLHAADAAPEEDGDKILPLPPRQQTVLTLLIDGKVPKEIAASLGLSVHTVRTYIRDIYAHFGVSGRPELLRRFMTGNGGDVPTR